MLEVGIGYWVLQQAAVGLERELGHGGWEEDLAVNVGSKIKDIKAVQMFCLSLESIKSAGLVWASYHWQYEVIHKLR